MADFMKAYLKMAPVEGLYSNDPDDPGGETVYGVARVFWPKWSGWSIVDAAKKQPGFPGNLKGNSALTEAVHAYYRQIYWDRFCLDELDQPLAYELFEQAVNLGEGRMVKHLQMVLNSLNYQNRFGEDLVVDGAFGAKTLQRLRRIVGDGRSRAIQYGANGQQCAHYINLGLTNAVKRKYTSGWLAQRGEAFGG